MLSQRPIARNLISIALCFFTIVAYPLSAYARVSLGNTVPNRGVLIQSAHENLQEQQLEPGSMQSLKVAQRLPLRTLRKSLGFLRETSANLFNSAVLKRVGITLSSALLLASLATPLPVNASQIISTEQQNNPKVTLVQKSKTIMGELLGKVPLDKNGNLREQWTFMESIIAEPHLMRVSPALTKISNRVANERSKHPSSNLLENPEEFQKLFPEGIQVDFKPFETEYTEDEPHPRGFVTNRVSLTANYDSYSESHQFYLKVIYETPLHNPRVETFEGDTLEAVLGSVRDQLYFPQRSKYGAFAGNSMILGVSVAMFSFIIWFIIGMVSLGVMSVVSSLDFLPRNSRFSFFDLFFQAYFFIGLVAVAGPVALGFLPTILMMIELLIWPTVFGFSGYGLYMARKYLNPINYIDALKVYKKFRQARAKNWFVIELGLSSADTLYRAKNPTKRKLLGISKGFLTNILGFGAMPASIYRLNPKADFDSCMFFVKGTKKAKIHGVDYVKELVPKEKLDAGFPQLYATNMFLMSEPDDSHIVDFRGTQCFVGTSFRDYAGTSYNISQKYVPDFTLELLRKNGFKAQMAKNPVKGKIYIFVDSPRSPEDLFKEE